MAYPVVTQATLDVYARLPAHYRDADARQTSGGGYPLLRWLSGIHDQMQDVDTLLARINYRTLAEGRVGADTSDLVDPLTADPAWLPWLGWLVGINASTRLTVAEQRAAIAGVGAGGFAAGSQGSLRAVVAPMLSGARVVLVVPGEFGRWTVGVHTRASETAILSWDGVESTFRDWGEFEAPGSWDGLSPRDVLVAITRANVTPAGVSITHTLGVAQWDPLEAQLPTWTAWEAAGSWAAVENIAA